MGSCCPLPVQPWDRVWAAGAAPAPGLCQDGDSSSRGTRAGLPGGPVPRLCSAGCKKLIYFWKSSSQSLSNSTRTSSVHSILNPFLLCFKFIKHNQCSLVKAALTRGAGEQWQSSISCRTLSLSRKAHR